jgi:hypothetical protein
LLTDYQKTNTHLSEIIVTVVGGLILALLLFLLNEYVFKKANLTGEWKTTICITETTYRPYENLKIEYKVHLLQKGAELLGSGEKIKDIHTDGSETKFAADKRVQLDIDGYFEKKYFRKCKIYLQVNEAGRIRETRATYTLTFDNKNKMTGTFISTAANQKGLVEMVRS